MNRGCQSLQSIIFSYREHRLEPSTMASSSKSRFSTGLILMSNEQKPNGKAAAILISPCHEWLCLPTVCLTRYRRLPSRESLTSSTSICSLQQRAKARMPVSNMRMRYRNGSTLFVAVICLQALMTLNWDRTNVRQCHSVIHACSMCFRIHCGSCLMWLRALQWQTY